MRGRYQHGIDESSHGIDLAPMLDFVVNLLIFFVRHRRLCEGVRRLDAAAR